MHQRRCAESADRVRRGAQAHGGYKRNDDELDCNKRGAGRSNDDVKALPSGQWWTRKFSHRIRPLSLRVCRSATGHVLQLFRVPGPLHRDLGGSATDLAEIV
jgi:hypothetical protein